MLYKFKAKLNSNKIKINLDGDILADSPKNAIAKLVPALAKQFKINEEDVQITAVHLLRKPS